MFYVYQYDLKTARGKLLSGVFDTAEDAISHIRLCYNADNDQEVVGRYYYSILIRVACYNKAEP